MIRGHEALAHRLVEEGLAPATLLTGPEGIGKQTLARSLAEHLSGIDATIVERLTVDAAREAVRLAAAPPLTSAHRTLVVDLDTATPTACHALLKALEEPLPTARWLLTASGSVLDTVRSRCQTIALTALRPQDVLDVLVGLGVPGDEATALVGLAGGSPGRALSLRPVLAERPRVLQLLKAVSSRNWVTIGQALRGTGSEEDRFGPNALGALRLWLAEALTGTHVAYGPGQMYGLDRDVPHHALLRAAEFSALDVRPSLAMTLSVRALLDR